MKKWYFALLLPIFYFLGCGGVTTNVTTPKQSVTEVITYKGPKARIAVASFKCKAAKCNGQIGSGISDMLTTALFRTGKFIVVERSSEGLGAIEKELSLGTVRNRPTRNLEGADILVVGAITAFEPKAGGITAGGIVVPRGVPLIGGMKFGKNEAYIAADIRLIDVRTGRIINATTVEGRASKWSVGGLGGGATSSIALGGGLSVYKNTPMEKAVRVMIDNAVKAIAKLVPENYYRYDAAGNPIKAVQPKTENTNIQNVSLNTQKKEQNYKLVFSETFDEYGNGQTIPFGKWYGDKFSVSMGVGPNGSITKVLRFAGNYTKICLKNISLKNLAIEFDFMEPTIDVYFRATKNPNVGYRVFLDNERVVLEKYASQIVTTIAKNHVKYFPKWNHAKITAINDHIQVFVNGKNIIDVIDSDKFMIRKGTVCIGSRYGDHFVDNIKIYKIGK